MEFVVVLFILVAAGAGVAGAISGGNRWKEVAARLGLVYGHGLQRSMSGMIEGFHVSLKQQKHHIDIRLSSDAIRGSINLSKEGFLSGVLGGRDIEIGCSRFDSSTYISSYSGRADAEISALLDHKTRSIITRVVVYGGAKVAGGNITHAKTNSIDEAASMVGGLVELARRLTMKTAEIPGRLAANALGDPVTSVRLRNLTLLQQEYRTSEEATTTSAALLTGPNPNDSLRLAAAMFLGADGLSVVQDVALSRHAMTDVRIKALQHLTRQAKREDMIEIATSLLADRNPRLQRMAIQSLGRLQHRPALDSIIAHLHSQDVATTLECIKAIENIGDSSAEDALVGLLHNTPKRVQTAAIEALAKIGTVRAVEPLHALTKRMGFKRSARVAIDSIQSRLGDVESGRLSLAPTIDPDGALSLAGDPEKAGGLSLDEK